MCFLSSAGHDSILVLKVVIRLIQVDSLKSLQYNFCYFEVSVNLL
jgi:hypothetical protein